VKFSGGDTALVLEYETDIPIENKEALGKEVAAIWERFRIDVEKAQVKSGVIRATHYESKGMFRSGNGFGFVYVKDADGNWKLSEDKTQKK
jgi:hypothetical protein